MAKKIRQLKGMLDAASFTVRAGKGSHTVWSHPKVARPVVLSGNDGDDAKPYQEKLVQRAIEESKS